MQDFYSKYYYENAKGKIVPLSAFTMTVVKQTSQAGLPLYDYYTPIGPYADLDDSSSFVNGILAKVITEKGL